MDGVGPRGELHGSKNAERPGGSCGATGALVLKNLAMSYFPAGTARSIIGAAELNCRVRNGNGWDLRAIVARKCCATICTGVLTGFVCVLDVLWCWVRLGRDCSKAIVFGSL
jgi:hypothetical protein